MSVEEFEHAGISIRIEHDEDAGNPRTEYDTALCVFTQLSTRDFMSPGGSNDQDERIVEAWTGKYNRHPHSIVLVERYARAYLDAVAVEWWDDPRSSSRIFAYITADGMRQGWGVSPWTVEDAQRVIAGELEEYRQWCEGEVYGYVVADGEPDEESCWGFFGLDYCIEEAKGIAQAVADDRANDALVAAHAEELAIERAELDPALG